MAKRSKFEAEEHNEHWDAMWSNVPGWGGY